MRLDSRGLFWEDTDGKTLKKETLLDEQDWVQVFPGFWAEEWRVESGEEVKSICLSLDKAYAIARAAKLNTKRNPPEPVWLAPDYLPGLEEARQFNVPLMTDETLIELAQESLATGKRHRFIYDIECYGNYFLIAMVSTTLGQVTYLELSDDSSLNCDKLQWIFDKFCLIGFYSNNYDLYIASLARAGCSTATMKAATSAIIEEQIRGYLVLRQQKVKVLKTDHMDIIEVAPLSASLKIYGGRMHTSRMQDLPFHPDSVLTEPQRCITRYYCVNDLRCTLELYNALKPQLALREQMSQQYAIDLRSKSDAQIAEAVIGDGIQKLNRCRAHKPKIEIGTVYYYKPPTYLQYQTPLMQGVLNQVAITPFVVSEAGNIGLPANLAEMSILINNTSYEMGIGGLHSKEKKACHYAGTNYIMKDVDVVSYYPFVILNQGLYPAHLGPNFLMVYRRIVERRVAAKKAGDKVVADSLKIVINGSFGKLGSKYSILYAPDLLMQVTITGQLSLLLLIERMELAGIPVVSANTDGIVIKCPKALEQTMDAIVAQWEIDTEFKTEEQPYYGLFSRDVNNYLAIKDPSTWKPSFTTDDKVKTKGIFATPGLSKNPQNEICIIAIKEFLINGTPINETVRGCTDLTKFINVRTVKGGAVKLTEPDVPGTYLGKAIRWYYADDTTGDIVYAKSGNKVPRSDGAQPIMDLPPTFPTNVNYSWYEKEAYKIMGHIGLELN